MITAVFDLDGTLADTLCDLADAVEQGLAKFGFPGHPYEQYKIFVGNGVRKLCERALPENEKDKTDALHEMFTQYYADHYLDKTVLYEGIHDALRELVDAGVKVAVATNKPQNFAREIMNALLPDIPFVKVLGGCDERPKKPDVAIIREILSDVDGGGKVYMIGDSNVDIMTAKNAGITSIGCTWGFRGREELVSAGADYIAEKASDITDIILSRR